MAADLFLALVLGRLSRLAMLGIETDAEEIERRVEAAVSLFLNGISGLSRGRRETPSASFTTSDRVRG